MGFASAVVGSGVSDFGARSREEITTVAGLTLQEQKRDVRVSSGRCRSVRIFAVQAREAAPPHHHQAVDSPIVAEDDFEQVQLQSRSAQVLGSVAGQSTPYYMTCKVRGKHLQYAFAQNCLRREGGWNGGMVVFLFSTVGESDAISMGTEGMCYNLQARDVIADSIETVVRWQHFSSRL